MTRELEVLIHHNAAIDLLARQFGKQGMRSRRHGRHQRLRWNLLARLKNCAFRCRASESCVEPDFHMSFLQ